MVVDHQNSDGWVIRRLYRVHQDFRLCGANPLLGRTFTAEDDMPNAPKTVVLAYLFWQRHFGGDSQVIGRRITLNGKRYEVIGVVDSILQDSGVAERSTLSGDIEIHEPPYVYLPFQIDANSMVIISTSPGA
jgi:hypothetical protein